MWGVLRRSLLASLEPTSAPSPLLRPLARTLLHLPAKDTPSKHWIEVRAPLTWGWLGLASREGTEFPGRAEWSAGREREQGWNTQMLRDTGRGAMLVSYVSVWSGLGCWAVSD